MSAVTAVTVKQAAQMTCPFIRDWTYDQRAQEGSPPVYEHIKCQGPSCMGWRWWSGPIDGFSDQRSERQGFCGVAGDQ